MNVDTGSYREIDAEGEEAALRELRAGEVLVVGTPMQVEKVSAALQAQREQRRRKNKAARRARRK